MPRWQAGNRSSFPWSLRRSAAASRGLRSFSLLRLADDHTLHVFVERRLAAPQDDDVDLLLALSLRSRVVVGAYVPAVEPVRLDELAKHLLHEPVLGRRPEVRAREHVDQRLRAAGFVRVVSRDLFVGSVGVAVHASGSSFIPR